MDQLMGSAGGYWLGKKAGQEFSSVGTDVSSISNSIEGGAKWLVNKVKGKVQKPLPELLKEHDIPAGIFPEDATNYEFDEETKNLAVHIPSVCEVGYRDSSVLRFSTKVTGVLEKGKLTGVEGLKTKFTFLWLKVSDISTEGTKIHFSAAVTRIRSRKAYDYVRSGISVDKF